jgi:hypothetical protein
MAERAITRYPFVPLVWVRGLVAGNSAPGYSSGDFERYAVIFESSRANLAPRLAAAGWADPRGRTGCRLRGGLR